MKLDITKTNIKYNNYSGLPFEIQFLKGQVRPVSLQTLQPSYASSKVKTKTMPSEIGFPTLTIDVFLNQKPNKQTSRE